MPTIENLNNWLVFPKRNMAAGLRVICFPYAGGNASTYMSWKTLLDPRAELVALQPPGRANRIFEPPIEHIGTLVEHVLAVLEALDDKPYLFYGHSLGAHVAFETMHELTLRQRPLPIHFVASGSPSPCARKKDDHLFGLPRHELREKLVASNPASRALLESDELFELCLPLLRAELKMAETYASERTTPLDVPFSLFAGVDDPISADEYAGWRTHTTRPLESKTYRGGHFFLEEHTASVVADVNAIVSAHGKQNGFW